MTYTIKQVSKDLNISEHTLRYYEKIGLVSPDRSENLYRSYTYKDIKKLKYISVLKYAKFTLSDIKSIVETLYIEPSDQCMGLNINLMTRKREALEHKVRIYKNLIVTLSNIESLLNNAKDFSEVEGTLYNSIQSIFGQIKGETE